MPVNILLAATDAHAAESAAEAAPLGLSVSSFAIQLITFLLFFFLLKRFAFTPIIHLLDKRRQTIDDGVRLGQKLERERDKLDDEVKKTHREARHEADKIIANANKEAREVIREAEKAAQRKTDAMISDAEARITEETRRAKKGLEKEIVGLVSEATETIVEEKVDPKKDAALIDKALKGRKKKK